MGNKEAGKNPLISGQVEAYIQKASTDPQIQEGLRGIAIDYRVWRTQKSSEKEWVLAGYNRVLQAVGLHLLVGRLEWEKENNYSND